MGFYKNVGVELSPVYAKFLGAKNKLGVKDGSTVVPTIINLLHRKNLITDKELKECVVKHGPNWGDGISIYDSGRPYYYVDENDRYCHISKPINPSSSREKLNVYYYDIILKMYKEMGFDVREHDNVAKIYI